MKRPDPRIALLFAGIAVVSALSGVVPAMGVLVSSALVAAASGLSWRRFLPLGGSFGAFLLLIPFSPGAATAAIVQGLAISFAVAASVSAARWDRLLAALQGFGLGRIPVAFLSIVFSHFGSTSREASRALDAIRLRGGFAGGARSFARSTQLLLSRTLHRVLERADRTADALTLRGYGGRVPALPRLKLRRGDLVPVLACVFAALLAVLSRLPWMR